MQPYHKRLDIFNDLDLPVHKLPGYLTCEQMQNDVNEYIETTMVDIESRDIPNYYGQFANCMANELNNTFQWEVLQDYFDNDNLELLQRQVYRIATTMFIAGWDQSVFYQERKDRSNE